jgi:CheY-like chemotaxis protein
MTAGMPPADAPTTITSRTIISGLIEVLTQPAYRIGTTRRDNRTDGIRSPAENRRVHASYRQDCDICEMRHLGAVLSRILCAVSERAKWVLVVDDDEDICAATVDVLQGAGYMAMAAPGGVAALRMIREGAPWLILSDLTMRDMDGRKLLTCTQELLGSSTPPFVFLTGLHPSGRTDVTEQVLTKPYEMDELLRVVEGHSRS